MNSLPFFRVQIFYFGLEVCFYKFFEVRKNCKHPEFCGHWIEPHVFCEVVNQNEVITRFVDALIMCRSPNISINKFKWCMTLKTIGMKRLLMCFINGA